MKHLLCTHCLNELNRTEATSSISYSFPLVIASLPPLGGADGPFSLALYLSIYHIRAHCHRCLHTYLPYLAPDQNIHRARTGPLVPTSPSLTSSRIQLCRYPLFSVNTHSAPHDDGVFIPRSSRLVVSFLLSPFLYVFIFPAAFVYDKCFFACLLESRFCMQPACPV
ncbi:hypothetical protein BC567DRAFT_55259 [Phyllosticta citribraziliensis]